MSKSKLIRHFSLAIGGFVLLLAFNNCDKGFMMADIPGEGAFSSGADCEESLMKIESYFIDYECYADFSYSECECNESENECH